MGTSRKRPLQYSYLLHDLVFVASLMLAIAFKILLLVTNVPRCNEEPPWMDESFSSEQQVEALFFVTVNTSVEQQVWACSLEGMETSPCADLNHKNKDMFVAINAAQMLLLMV